MNLDVSIEEITHHQYVNCSNMIVFHCVTTVITDQEGVWMVAKILEEEEVEEEKSKREKRQGRRKDKNEEEDTLVKEKEEEQEGEDLLIQEGEKREREKENNKEDLRYSMLSACDATKGTLTQQSF
jgi:hypothetical protein